MLSPEEMELPAGTVTWCQHHAYTYPVPLEISCEKRLGDRLRFIQIYKPEHERATRLQWFAVADTSEFPSVLKDLIADLNARRGTVHRLTAELRNIEGVHSWDSPYVTGARTSLRHSEAMAVTQWRNLVAIIKQFQGELIAIHQKQQPGCPWDYDECQMIFPTEETT